MAGGNCRSQASLVTDGNMQRLHVRLGDMGLYARLSTRRVADGKLLRKQCPLPVLLPQVMSPRSLRGKTAIEPVALAPRRKRFVLTQLRLIEHPKRNVLAHVGGIVVVLEHNERMTAVLAEQMYLDFTRAPIELARHLVAPGMPAQHLDGHAP